jgi:hypothetical protein
VPLIVETVNILHFRAPLFNSDHLGVELRWRRFKQGREIRMNVRLQQLEAEGRVDADAYRTYMLLSVMTKLVMALIVGVLVLCSFLIV